MGVLVFIAKWVLITLGLLILLGGIGWFIGWIFSFKATANIPGKIEALVKKILYILMVVSLPFVIIGIGFRFIKEIIHGVQWIGTLIYGWFN